MLRYDEGILNIGLSYRQMLDIAYRRIKGGYLLTDRNRQKYTDLLTVHRKKGLEYAREENNEEKAELFAAL